MSLVPARHNFTLYPGATFFKSITYTVDGDTVDVAGYSAELIIKDEPDGEVLLTLLSSAEEEDTGIKIGGENGIIELLITDEDTDEIKWTSGIYELFLTDLLGRTDVLMRGGFKVVPF